MNGLRKIWMMAAGLLAKEVEQQLKLEEELSHEEETIDEEYVEQ